MTPDQRSPVHGFTFRADRGRASQLVTDAAFCAGFDPKTFAGPPPEMKRFPALWDTGAQRSVITREIVDACGLKPTGMARVHGVSGVHDTETFLVNIGLPNGVAFANLRVTLGILQGFKALIGMDIISRGDFAITHPGGATVFSFQYPSTHDIDFVGEINASNKQAQLMGRQAPPQSPGQSFYGRSRKKKR